MRLAQNVVVHAVNDGSVGAFGRGRDDDFARTGSNMRGGLGPVGGLTQDCVDLNQKHQTVIHVNPLDADALIRLTDKILKLYRQCYALPEFCTSEHAFAYVSSQMTAEDAVTRHYVIALTAYLDALKTQ